MRTVLAIGDSDLLLALQLLLNEEPRVNIVGTTSELEGLLSLIETTGPDLVLLDWELPGRPLKELLAEALSYQKPPRIIVIGNNVIAKESALQSGADSFVVIGEQPEKLLAAVRQTSHQEIINPDLN